MLRAKRIRVLAVLASIGALLVLGASQAASMASRGPDSILNTISCTGPSKVFSFAMTHQGADLVSALKMRIAPEVAVSHLRFDPQPEMILKNRDGLMELKYSERTMSFASRVSVELCGANVSHQVREAFFVVQSEGQQFAQLVSADNITWTWRDSGEDVIPGTRLATKEISCAGNAVVQMYQLVSKDQPLCVKNPEALAEIQEKMAKVGDAQASFIGRLQTVMFGSSKFEAELAQLNEEMLRLYLYAPYDGMVEGVAYDAVNGVTWIKLQVEEGLSDGIRVAE